MRLAFLGTSEFAVAVLRRVVGSEFRPSLVITPPDRPRGRGRRLAPPPVAAEARALGLELHQTASVSSEESTERVKEAGAQIGVVCAFGQLIRDPLLSELEMLNVHPSLLPRWRGAAPIERAIMAGDDGTGMTVLQVTAGLDSGPIAVQEPLPIARADDFGSLAGRLAERGGKLIVEALRKHAAGSLELTEQDDSAATYAEKIRPEERRLDPSRSAEELERIVRALNPHIGAFLELEGEDRLRVREAVVADGELSAGDLVAHAGTLRLGCGAGLLELRTVQPAGGRPMSAEAYLRGHSPPASARHRE